MANCEERFKSKSGRDAEKGEAHAQFEVGLMYAKGDGIPKDRAEAVNWYRKAADQGYDRAQYNLGVMYGNGDGIPKDSVEAIRWYRLAAVQGNARAQFNLGAVYGSGEGVPQDEVEGLAWTNIAAASGDDDIVKRREVMAQRVGRTMALVAQQRSKEIVREIEVAKRSANFSRPRGSATSTPTTEEIPKASGSGAIISMEGYVLTAAHVVAGANRVEVLTAQGIKTATVLRIDEANDVAVLKLDEGTYPALPVVPSRRIRLGQSVATIGFPNVEIQGFSPKVTRGEISSLNGIGDDPRA